MKIKLTKQEMKTLENVFNYAIRYLDDQDGFLFVIGTDGTAEHIDVDKKVADIESLFNLIKDRLEIIDKGE